jgi:AcrR family transcriptional regulator
MASEKIRAKIADALVDLSAHRDLADIGLADIARAAGVSLGTLRESFEGKTAMLADFSRRIDRAVLDGGATEEGSPRERLFEILMRRFDALRPHVAGLKGLARSARRDPGLAAVLYGLALGSQKWMLEAAAIHRAGLSGAVATHGSVLVFADAFRVFLEDDDPGLAPTMAALDRALERGDRAMRILGDVCAIPGRFAGRGGATAAEGG